LGGLDLVNNVIDLLKQFFLCVVELSLLKQARKPLLPTSLTQEPCEFCILESFCLQKGSYDVGNEIDLMLVLIAKLQNLTFLKLDSPVSQAFADNSRQTLVLPIAILYLLIEGRQCERVCQLLRKLHHDDRAHSLVQILLEVVDFLLEGNNLLEEEAVTRALQQMHPELENQIS